MADLHNLLEEVEAADRRSHEFHDDADEDIDFDDGKPTMAAGRPSVETAVTEPLSYSDDDNNNNDNSQEYEDWDSPSASTTRHFVSIPVALQDAKRSKANIHDGRNLMENRGERGLYNNDDVEEDIVLGEENNMIQNELYTRLHQFWHDEQHCPEILQYDTTMVEELKAQMEERQEWIDEMTAYAGSNQSNNNDSSSRGVVQEAGDLAVQTLLTHLAQVDLDRTNYVLTCWLGERLAKIEQHPLHMRDKVDKLSDEEIEYLKEYGSLLHEHLHQTVLDHIPQAWQRLDEPNMIDVPDYDRYHFWLVEEPIIVEDVEQDEGNTLVAKYSAMKEFMNDNKVELLL